MAAIDFVLALIGEDRLAAIVFAARLEELAMHVDHAPRARAFMQVVDVLRAEEEAVAVFDGILQCGQRQVRRIRLRLARIAAALRVEAPDKARVGLQPSGVATSSMR